ncbi:MAG: polysaccharide deacetylase family protein [Lachnospiraceae bacterium]|uniref:polysaccharide deacetylase family protein n=1 Tax=Falcatimonas sp. MSJ-15 TaxID=2841515 RepID=UPI002EC73C33|nr:polysaccharide deacetylase family protein [Lachnospiraceae bacterium]
MKSISKIKRIILIINILLTIIVGLLWIDDIKKETIVEKYEEKFVAITFDDGPNRSTTEKLLDGLKQRDVKATFFVIGENIEGNEDIIRRMKEEGHEIGNHTYTHCDLSRVSRDCALKEIDKTNELIYKITGEMPQYIRPPFGNTSDRIFYIEEMTVVLWQVDPMDWNTNNADKVVNLVVKNVKPNDIILLHDIYDSSVSAALRIIDELQDEGYVFVLPDVIFP